MYAFFINNTITKNISALELVVDNYSTFFFRCYFFYRRKFFLTYLRR